MDNKNTGLLVAIIILVLLVGGLGSFIVYDKFLNNNSEKNTINQDNKTNNEDNNSNTNNDNNNNQDNNNLKTVPTSDKVTLNYEATDESFNIFYAYIEDGILYYNVDNKIADNNSTSAFKYIGNFSVDSEGKNTIQKYNGLNGIKRIKTYNIGTGIKQVSYLITENGQVYNIQITNGKINVTIDNNFNSLKVEDILSHTGEMSDTFEILLKDGTTKTITDYVIN